MPEPAPPILVVGSTMIDLIAYADVLPEAGQTIVGTGFAMGFGGKGANQAVAAARLGARVAMVNCLGEDSYGADTLRNFEEQGVDATWVRQVPGSSGVAPIWVDAAGMNRIICVPGANDETSPELAVAAFDAVGPSVVVAQFETPAGDDRRRVRARPGRRRDHGPQPGAGGPDRGCGHRGHRLARPQRARVRADRRRDARRRRGRARTPRSVSSRSAWTSRSS